MDDIVLNLDILHFPRRATYTQHFGTQGTVKVLCTTNRSH